MFQRKYLKNQIWERWRDSTQDEHLPYIQLTQVQYQARIQPLEHNQRENPEFRGRSKA